MGDTARGVARWIVGSAAVVVASMVVGVGAMLLVSFLFDWCGLPLHDDARYVIFGVVAMVCVMAGMYALERAS